MSVRRTHQRKHSEDVAFLKEAPKQVDIVRSLTKANHQTFECLKVLCENYNRQFLPSITHKCIVEQASKYFETLELSCKMADTGMQVSREAMEVLDPRNPPEDPENVAEIMLGYADEALRDAQLAIDCFRTIRKAVSSEMQRVNPDARYRSRNFEETAAIDPDDVRSMSYGEVLQMTYAILGQFVGAVAGFIDWWNSLKVDIDRLINAIEMYQKNDKFSARVRRQWGKMEDQFKIYKREITDQQDYYDDVIKEMVPKKLHHRVIYSIMY